MEKIVLRRPFFVVNPKSYLYGEDLRRLAAKTDELCERYGLQSLFTAQLVDLPWIVGNCPHLIPCAQTMVANDVLVVDLDGNIVEGTRKASVDTQALLYILKKMPKVNAVIHTHQPYATGLGLVMDEIPCNLSTMANAVEGPCHVAAYGDPGSLSMHATRVLDGEGIACQLIEMATIEPLDEASIDQIGPETLVVTVEEHYLAGGLGSAISERLASRRIRPRVLHLAAPYSDFEADDPENLITRAGLSADAIASQVRKALGNLA